MSSPEEQKFILDLISSYIKPWRPHMSAEDAELQDPSGHAPVETLCLRRTELTDIGGSIVNHHMLKVSSVCASLKPTGFSIDFEGRRNKIQA